MKLNDFKKKIKVREVLREAFFLIAIIAVFVMVPQRCGLNPDNMAGNENKNERTGEITYRDKSAQEGFSFWLREFERRQGPGE